MHCTVQYNALLQLWDKITLSDKSFSVDTGPDSLWFCFCAWQKYKSLKTKRKILTSKINLLSLVIVASWWQSCGREGLKSPDASLCCANYFSNTVNSEIRTNCPLSWASVLFKQVHFFLLLNQSQTEFTFITDVPQSNRLQQST